MSATVQWTDIVRSEEPKHKSYIPKTLTVVDACVLPSGNVDTLHV